MQIQINSTNLLNAAELPNVQAANQNSAACHEQRVIVAGDDAQHAFAVHIQRHFLERQRHFLALDAQLEVLVGAGGVHRFVGHNQRVRHPGGNLRDPLVLVVELDGDLLRTRQRRLASNAQPAFFAMSTSKERPSWCQKQAVELADRRFCHRWQTLDSVPEMREIVITCWQLF